MEILLGLFALCILSVLGSMFIRISWWILKAFIGLIGLVFLLSFLAILL